MYEIFARTSHRAINMRCMRFSRKRRNVAKKSDALLRKKATHCCEEKRRTVAKKNDALLRRKATHCCEDENDALLRRRKRRTVAKTKTTHCCEDKSDALLRRRKRRIVAKTQCKQNYCDVSSFKNKFFVQIRRYIRSLMQKSNCEIKNFDVLEILQLKFSCMKIYIENFNFR
jgi:hypothetical protein